VRQSDAQVARDSEAAIADLVIVVPTFNERDNIAPLLQKLDETLRGVHWEVVFVDDDSTDGTMGRWRTSAGATGASAPSAASAAGGSRQPSWRASRARSPRSSPSWTATCARRAPARAHADALRGRPTSSSPFATWRRVGLESGMWRRQRMSMAATVVPPRAHGCD
jgi:hypothetical protein